MITRREFLQMLGALGLVATLPTRVVSAAVDLDAPCDAAMRLTFANGVAATIDDLVSVEYRAQELQIIEFTTQPNYERTIAARPGKIFIIALVCSEDLGKNIGQSCRGIIEIANHRFEFVGRLTGFGQSYELNGFSKYHVEFFVKGSEK